MFQQCFDFAFNQLLDVALGIFEGPHASGDLLGRSRRTRSRPLLQPIDEGGQMREQLFGEFPTQRAIATRRNAGHCHIPTNIVRSAKNQIVLQLDGIPQRTSVRKIRIGLHTIQKLLSCLDQAAGNRLGPPRGRGGHLGVRRRGCRVAKELFVQGKILRDLIRQRRGVERGAGAAATVDSRGPFLILPPPMRGIVHGIEPPPALFESRP